jgi:hypothetical protein
MLSTSREMPCQCSNLPYFNRLFGIRSLTVAASMRRPVFVKN